MDDRDYLTPAELDFRRDPSVTALGGDRYVVATDAPADSATHRSATRRQNAPASDESRTGRLDTDGGVAVAESTTFENRPDSDGGSEPASASPGDAATSGADYFVDIAVRTDEGTYDTRFEGDDIGEVCASMLRWYAGHVSPTDDPKNVLSVLLSRSDLSL